jgi:pimeloyl-ACP methyl ester carboxylesterase
MHCASPKNSQKNDEPRKCGSESRFEPRRLAAERQGDPDHEAEFAGADRRTIGPELRRGRQQNPNCQKQITGHEKDFRSGYAKLERAASVLRWRSRARRTTATLRTCCRPCSNPGRQSSWCGARTFQTVDYAERHAREIPETRLVRIKSAGHIPMENDPKTVAGALAEFFATQR